MKFAPQLLAEISKNKYLNSFPNLKQKKTQELTTIALTLIALSIFGLFAINPTLSTIAQLQREFVDSKDVDEKLRQKIINLGQLQTQFATLTPDLPFVYAAVPESPRPAQLVAQVQTIAQQSNVNLVRIQTFQADLLQKTQSNKTPSYVFALTAEGNPENVNNFMKNLVNFDRLLTIDNLILSTGPDGSGLLEFNMRGRAYFKP